jgi:hypothetical protein
MNELFTPATTSEVVSDIKPKYTPPYFHHSIYALNAEIAKGNSRNAEL